MLKIILCDDDRFILQLGAEKLTSLSNHRNMTQRLSVWRLAVMNYFPILKILRRSI